MYRYIFIFFLISWTAFSQDIEKKGGIEKYTVYTAQIKALYTTSLHLAKSAKDSGYKNASVHKKIQDNLSLVSRFCSTSFESQLYFKAQQENRNSEKYQYNFSRVSKSLFKQRKEVYEKCKRMQALLSRASFKLERKIKKKFYNVDVQNHESIFAGTQHIYQEIRGVNEKLFSSRLPPSAKAELLNYYNNYKGFTCDWVYEKKLFLNAKLHLRSKIAITEKEMAKDRLRGVASSSKNFELTTILGDLEKRHVSFEKMCEEIQLEKDKINKKIETLY